MPEQAADELVEERMSGDSPIDPDNHLGRVFAVPDDWWGFKAVGREDHPGACVHEIPARQRWILLKGTGAAHHRGSRYDATEVVVLPTTENGLLKNTLFSLRPREFKRHRLRNLVSDRTMGQLSPRDLERLRGEMIRQFGLPR